MFEPDELERLVGEGLDGIGIAAAKKQAGCAGFDGAYGYGTSCTAGTDGATATAGEAAPGG